MNDSSARNAAEGEARHPCRSASPPTASCANCSASGREHHRRGSQRLASYTEEQLDIATTPKDEVWRQDTVRLYRYRPMVEKPSRVPILIAYALVGRYQMIDLEPDRPHLFVRKPSSRKAWTSTPWSTGATPRGKPSAGSPSTTTSRAIWTIAST